MYNNDVHMHIEVLYMFYIERNKIAYIILNISLLNIG